jgi:hypothetical protein
MTENLRSYIMNDSHTFSHLSESHLCFGLLLITLIYPSSVSSLMTFTFFYAVFLFLLLSFLPLFLVFFISYQIVFLSPFSFYMSSASVCISFALSCLVYFSFSVSHFSIHLPVYFSRNISLLLYLPPFSPILVARTLVLF